MKPCTSSAQSASGWSGTINYISGIAQGDNYVNRDGNSIRVTHFTLTGTAFKAAASTTNDTMRILVVRDLFQAGTTPSVSDILAASSIGTAIAPYAGFEPVNGKHYSNRFTILFDELVSLDSGNPTQMIRFESSRECHIMYKGTTSAIASAGAGSYFLICVSNSNVNTPTFDYFSEITFTDN